MRKFIIAFLIILVSFFFVNNKANFKYDVNYLTANRHMDELVTITSENKEEAIYKYILNEVSKYDVEVIEHSDSIIVIKNSHKTNAKDVGFITNYNSFEEDLAVNNSALAVSSMLGTIQAYNNQETDNNLYYIFSKNKDKTLNGNISFLQTNKKEFEDLDYIFSFDSKGVEGELYIYRSTQNNKTITNFYKETVTSAAGFSDFTVNFDTVKLDDVELMSFALLNNEYLYKSEANTLDILDENSINNYVNTVNELVKNSHTYDFNSESKELTYFNYLDNFVTLNAATVIVSLVVSIIGFMAFIYMARNELNYKKISISSLIYLTILPFAIMMSILPIREILSFFTSNEGRMFIENITYGFVIIITLIYAGFAYSMVHKKYKFTYTECIISSIINTYIFITALSVALQSLNAILSITALLLVIILYLYKYVTKKQGLILNTFMTLILPVIMFSLYFMYSITNTSTLIFFTILYAIYVTIVLPIFLFHEKTLDSK